VPNPSKGNTFLGGVSCSSPAACTAVGTRFFSGAGYAPVIESWNGTRWSLMSTPRKPKTDLNAVSCASAGTCTTVGSYLDPKVVYQPVAEAWDGTKWSIVPTPTPKYGRLFGVSCVSATNCTAAGNYWPTPLKNTRDLVESWNGTSWSQSTVPDKGPLGGLFGVSCASADFCTAVGDYGGSSSSATLIETGTAGT
jgi:hypothetical protein